MYSSTLLRNYLYPVHRQHPPIPHQYRHGLYVTYRPHYRRDRRRQAALLLELPNHRVSQRG